ncbi:MAG: DUF1501 domain-containing protein [Maricaulaceae bacterium]
MTVNKRDLLRGGLAATALALTPRMAFAQGLDGRKLVFVILRGAMDGLSFAIPYAERRLMALRADLTPEAATAHDLGDGFALHPSLTFTAGLYAKGELAVMHAAATPYRERSHFDGQDVLESGAAKVFGAHDGWLNRALQKLDNPAEAVAIAQALPLALRGVAPASSWSPNVLPEASADTLARLGRLYAQDALLGPAWEKAVATDAVAGETDLNGRARGRGGPINYETLLQAAGRLMAADSGPGLAVVGLDGWDTHANQGADQGQLARRFAVLDAGLSALKTELGSAWSKTVVVLATEFGRTVAMNGTRGTDHGAASAAVLAGGAVRGGRMLGDWPGLDTLYEDRDLRPVNDLRGLFKGVLADHWGLSRADLDGFIFPDSRAVAPVGGLVGV